MTDGQTQFDSTVSSLSEQLTRNFYRWEKRSRGWKFWDDVVELEPPYEPFYYHWVPRPTVKDDGRIPTLFSSIIEAVRRRIKGSPSPMPASTDDSSSEELEPELFDDSSAIHEMTISLLPEQKVSLDYAENLFLNLRAYPNNPEQRNVIMAQTK